MIIIKIINALATVVTIKFLFKFPSVFFSVLTHKCLNNYVLNENLITLFFDTVSVRNFRRNVENNNNVANVPLIHLL